jgi:hypothetical protein
MLYFNICLITKLIIYFCSIGGVSLDAYMELYDGAAEQIERNFITTSSGEDYHPFITGRKTYGITLRSALMNIMDVIVISNAYFVVL